MKLCTIILMMFLIVFSAVDVFSQSPLILRDDELARVRGDELARNLRKNVVKITVRLSGGLEQNGFGFVVGELNNRLYIATANHVIRSKEPDVNTEEIQVIFFENQGRSFPATQLDVYNKDIDLTLVEIPKPEGYAWERDRFYSDCKRNDYVWFIGRNGDWWIPTRTTIGTINRIYIIEGQIVIDIRSVRPGTSGAPLLTEYGIVGMIVEDTTDDEAFAVQIDRIRQAVENWNYPWNTTNTTTTMPSTTTTTIITTAIHPPFVATKELSNKFGMKFIYIPPTEEFIMGSPGIEPERESDEMEHKVKFEKGFYIQTTEVTKGQQRAVMDNKPFPFENSDDNYPDDNYPIENVSWDNVQIFIKELNQKDGKNYRLPTEAEWEYACRAGTYTPFSFGICLSTDQANYNGDFPLMRCSKGIYQRKAVPVASFSPNPWGLYDMHGNVWEWCHDWYGVYPSDSVIVNPTGPISGSIRVIRGGGWDSHAKTCRSASRYRVRADNRPLDLGFRLVLPLD